MYKRCLLALICLGLFALQPLTAKEQRKARTESRSVSLQDRYSHVLDTMQRKAWKELIKEGKTILTQFPFSPFAHDVRYFMGIAYFQMGDFELANRMFSDYLKNQSSPQYFEEAIGYKFSIAQRFEEGARRHVMGWEKMPQWMPGREVALIIYDEVITSLPRHDLAAQSLYRKGFLLYQMEEYKQSVETFQSLIRRFPKHSLAPESYLGISQTFLRQCQRQFPDPDFLDLAEINLNKFKQDFPGEPRIAQAQDMLLSMHERFAKELYDIGKFFERTKKPSAAGVYYKNIMVKYTETQSAIKSKKRLIALDQPIPELDVEPTPKSKPVQGIIVESESAENDD